MIVFTFSPSVCCCISVLEKKGTKPFRVSCPLIGSDKVYKILTTVRWRGHSNIALQLVQSYTIKNNIKDIISQCVSFSFGPLFLCHKDTNTTLRPTCKIIWCISILKKQSSANPEKLYMHVLALCKNWTEIFNTLIGGKFYSKAQIKKKKEKN